PRRVAKMIVSSLRARLARVELRFRRARPGSVLIMVVGLLVVMALVGATFVTTTRIDRYASVQHSENTQIDLLLEGVINMAQATIVADVYEGGNYRPVVSTT